MQKYLHLMGVPAGWLLAGLMLLLAIAGPALARTGADALVYLPFVTSPLVAVESYETEFTDSIAPWTAVRWQKGAGFEVDHKDDCDRGRCDFLSIKVEDSETYAIASPLILGPQRPYVIETRARLHEREDKHQFGIVFGADAGGAACPGDNSNACFNHYYEFRVRYRDVNGDQFLEYRLRRIDGHDGNNVEQGEDLIDWTRADGVDPADWHKWSVRYGVRGDITFKVDNNTLAGSAQDTKYDDPLYFGLLGRAGETESAQAWFDSFSIALQQ